MFPRRALLALSVVVALAASGCHSPGLGLFHRPPVPIAAQPNLEASELVARYNRNAQRVTSLQAKPSITIASLTERRRYMVRGRMALERPKNFRLVLEMPASRRSVADFGSNPDEFWFWVEPWKDQTLHVCRYNASGSSPLAVTYQPDWILESLGLRELPEIGTQGVSAKRDGARTILTARSQGAQGEGIARETVIDSATGQVLEHRLYSGEPLELVAKAKVTGGYQAFPLPAGAEADPAPSTGSAAAPANVILPRQVSLVWVKEQFQLDVTLGDVKLNAPLGQSAALFSEPAMEGIARRDLKQELGITDSGETLIRETLSAPQPSHVRLGDPEPFSPPEATRDGLLDPDTPALAEYPSEPSPSRSYSSSASTVVRARLPQPPPMLGLPPEESAQNWRSVPDLGFSQ